MADPKKYLAIYNDGTNDLYIKDLEAQQAIVELQKSVTGAMHFLGVSETAISDGQSTGSWVIDGVTFVPSGATGQQVNLKAGDAAIYGAKEFVWSGASGSWKEYGDMSSLKSLAYKDASDIETAGSTSQKLVTASVTGVSGSTSVTGVDGSVEVLGIDGSTSVYGCGDNTTVHDTPSLGTTNIYGCGDNATVHDTPTLNTSNIYGCGDNTTVHDTPTLNTSNIYGCGDNASVGSASNWSAGTAPSLTYDETNEKLTFSPGTVPSLTITSTTVATKADSATAVGTSLTAGTAVTVATKAAEATAVGTSLTAGEEITVATKASSATAVGTSIVAGDAITVATKASAATTVPVAASAATTVPVAASTATTVPTAAASATTVATGAVANDGAGASVVTAVSTTIQNKATV